MKDLTQVFVESDAAVFVLINTAEKNIPGYVRLVLIQDRDTGTKFFKPPGGKKEGAESFSETIHREIWEELRVKLYVHESEDLFFRKTIKGNNPHEFVVFAHNEPADEDFLRKIKLRPEITGVFNAVIFDSQQLVDILKANLILPKYVEPLQNYLVEHKILLR